MSDFQQLTGWQIWQPEDLCKADMLSEELPVIEGETTPEQQQAELQRLRRQAEQKGLAQGQAQGIEEGRKQGYDEGYQQGHQAGIEQGQAEAKERQEQTMSQFAELLQSFQTAIDNLEKIIPSRLVQLALMAARATLGKNVALDNHLLLEKIQSLLQQEPLFQAPVQLWVNADEFSTVQEQLSDVLKKHGWELRADDAMLPGGCRITSAECELDATVSSSWQALCQLSREDYGA
ncbi:flagellar assembly protein FliH [Mixta theicola]|uniref:Flagellar assembly protein FliH n=1 Tax=Mixta theicola TaxID=1458355 RepID=A0A2K1Q834_9GAMM|nr:flagellar assembly protein FliH [Mixta theicola]PNS11186.1 flagellar assembly protein FliH [Mixta theicola]GLR07551.1 flagellar assembly protein FliH [Mixta theicola]